MKKDNSPNDLGPLADFWALVTAFTDAMNLRHLRSDLFAESPDLVPLPLKRPSTHETDQRRMR